MGGAMAARLLSLGWRVQVCDLDAARTEALHALGAAVCATPKATATGCGALIVCVVDAVQTNEVLFGGDGASSGWGPGLPVLLCPTIGPESSEAVAARVEAGGAVPVDVPMSGGPQRARDGSMSLMVACADEVFSRVEPLLQALSSLVFRI
jgi:3-hydroxyisobutyrate dehydrogenase